MRRRSPPRGEAPRRPRRVSNGNARGRSTRSRVAPRVAPPTQVVAAKGSGRGDSTWYGCSTVAASPEVARPHLGPPLPDTLSLGARRMLVHTRPRDAVRRFARDQRGATTMEYGFVIVLVALVAVVVMGKLGTSVERVYTSAGERLSGDAGSAGGGSTGASTDAAMNSSTWPRSHLPFQLHRTDVRNRSLQTSTRPVKAGSRIRRSIVRIATIFRWNGRRRFRRSVAG